MTYDKFNPRTRMGCDCFSPCLTRSPPNFNPRTRMGCDLTYLYDVRCIRISIHAPAWGATDTAALDYRYTQISIHAPAWGATCEQAALAPAGAHFNPRTRMGCDRMASSVTIHCLPFQSTHPHGVRRDRDHGRVSGLHNFNPRTRMGCDGIDSNLLDAGLNFNPRTRMGCDNDQTNV